MKALFEEYSGVVISIFCVISVLGILFFGITDKNGNRGIYNILGAEVNNSSSTEAPDNGSYNAMDGYANKTKPTVEQRKTRIVAGTVYNITDLFKVTDSKGDDATISKITSITLNDVSGDVDKTSSYASDTKSITFPGKGTYTIVMKIKDRQTGKRTTISTNVLVNSR